MEMGDLYLYPGQDDLSALARLCPEQANLARDRIAEIAFVNAEEVRRALTADDGRARDNERERREALEAIADYQKARGAERFAFRSEQGAGTLYLWLAGWDSDDTRQYLSLAADAFERAVNIAADAGDTGNEATVRTSHGESLLRLGEATGTSDAAQAQTLFRHAVETLGTANTLATTPGRRLLLARAQHAVGDLSDAKASFQDTIPALTGDARAIAQLDLAEVLQMLGEETHAQSILETVASENEGNPAIQFEVGRRLFQDGKIHDARKALLLAVDVPDSTDRAEANYLLSVTETIVRPSGWAARAVLHAERAVQLGNGDPDYSRQACLTHIQRGGRTLRDGADAPWCARQGTAEESLLYGMYLLKRAQSMEVSAYSASSQTRWRAMLADAEDAFRDGLAKLPEVDSLPAKIRFDDLQRDVDIAKQLGYGLLVVRRCRRDVVINPGDPDWSELQAFFGHYGVLRCS